MDKVSAESRSAVMAAIRSKNTKPELALRHIAHRLGYRFRLHRKDLPGKPDLVFPARRAVVFVHGCFWHNHPDPTCKAAGLPKSKLDYWEPKLAQNVARDAANVLKLSSLGWRVLVVWECEIKDLQTTEARLLNFLGPPGGSNPTA